MSFDRNASQGGDGFRLGPALPSVDRFFPMNRAEVVGAANLLQIHENVFSSVIRGNEAGARVKPRRPLFAISIFP